MTAILTLNTGSSSLKFGVYEDAVDPVLRFHGGVSNIGHGATLTIEGDGRTRSAAIDAPDHHGALDRLMAALRPHLAGLTVAGVGHRIVHGGLDFADPVELTPAVVEALTQLIPLAPLHQPQNLDGVRLAARMVPDAVQIGCFDTAFHRGHPWVNDTFALPRTFYDAGVRRYGFHGLSYDYITGHIAQAYPDLRHGKLIIAHLGNGASMCAVQDGRSVGSTMGFSALDGLPMGTRCGQIDPGAVLYLIDQQGMDPKDVLDLLYHQSGLLGLSGLTSDMRDLLAAGTPESAQAIDYYVFRARREIGALSAVLGGIDGLVFCGGIGENAPEIRGRIMQDMGYLGLSIDTHANEAGAAEIGAGPTRILVIPTDEERVIARAVSVALARRKAA